MLILIYERTILEANRLLAYGIGATAKFDPALGAPFPCIEPLSTEEYRPISDLFKSSLSISRFARSSSIFFYSASSALFYSSVCSLPSLLSTVRRDSSSLTAPLSKTGVRP